MHMMNMENEAELTRITKLLDDHGIKHSVEAFESYPAQYEIEVTNADGSGNTYGLWETDKIMAVVDGKKAIERNRTI